MDRRAVIGDPDSVWMKKMTGRPRWGLSLLLIWGVLA